MAFRSRVTLPALCLLASFATACRTDGGAAGLKDATTTPNPVAAQMIAQLDGSCALSGCHNSGHTGKLPFATLTTFATQTRSYHQCLKQAGCYADTLAGPVATACWQCVTGSGGLEANGGIFQAAIRTGLVKKIATAANVPAAQLDNMLQMPPTPSPAEHDIAATPAGFKALADWLAAEADDNFVEIASVRPADTSTSTSTSTTVGLDNTCDRFSPVVEATIVDDFHMDHIDMFGCPGSGWPDDPNACFGSLAKSPFTDAGTPGLVVKELRKLTGRTSYWMRTSTDGRFSSVGNGHIEDLKTVGRSIKVDNSSIDPVYSPDNKLYAWPGMICPMAPLYDLTVTEVGPQIAASGCTSQSVGVYRSMGTDANGDILMIQGYTNNNFGGGSTDASNMPGAFGGFTIGRIANNHITNDNITVTTPFETDYQMSPAGKLIVGRFKDGANQEYRIRTVRPDGHTINPAEPTTTGVICMKGEKANMSYDNRFVAFHHYADASPQDAGAQAGHANIFVYDIKKHKGIRVTNMTNGSKAFFPHFRADGWLYFLIKGADGVESINASNAALVLKAMP